MVVSFDLHELASAKPIPAQINDRARLETSGSISSRDMFAQYVDVP
jgi:hypothetical protein